ncbi:MAG: LysM peptidoglycan-binding domain-containing protein [Bacteroidaceae bacterium]|nr:LysM peptidoglycan-binding domain-containing protein [Bacteroidaceae bacterium]
MKKVLLLLMTFVTATMMLAQSTTQKHEVQSGETLYSIARQYNVTVASLLQINPGLDADHIMAGQSINVPAGAQRSVAAPVNQQPVQPVQQTQPVQQSIQQQVLQQVRQQVQAQQGVEVPSTPNRPRYKTLHEVKKKETLYSISRLYGITVDQLVNANPDLKKTKLKKGVVLNIPYTTAEDTEYQAEQQRAIEEASKPKVIMYPTIKVAVILPFSKTEEKVSAESQKMINLYQGFLLAVDSLKQRGCNVEVFAYDEASPVTPVASVLQKPEMKDMQLIVGPIRQWNVKSVADFAHQNNIAHVVPLSNDLSLVNEHPTTFQVNSHNSLLYNQVYNRFYLIHKDHNIIFVNMNDRGDNMPYITDFKKDLEAKGVQYSNASAADFATVRDVLKKGMNNTIIPTSGSTSAFETLCKKLDGLDLTSEYTVQLFGFPEWQTLQGKNDKYLGKYQCQFFTSFYSNEASTRIQQFNGRFHRWFNQDQYNSFPKYGELGYDIGAYFIKGLHDFGSAFYENLHNYSYISMEFPMMFEKKNSWSGYQNHSMMIVTHRTDGSVFVR